MSVSGIIQVRRASVGVRERLGAALGLLLFLASSTGAAAAAGNRGRMQPEDLRRMFEEGQYLQVKQASEAAIASKPGDPELHYWLARSAYELSAYDTAIREAEEAARLAPDNSEIQLILGRAYGRKADIESSFFLARKTRKAFEAAVRLDPSNISARRDLCEYYANAPWFLGGGKDKARQQVEAIAAVDKAKGLLALADFYAMTGQTDKAREQYRLLLQQNPPQVSSYLEALAFYEDQGDAASLARTLEGLESLAPHDPRLLYFRSVSRIIRGAELDQAEAELKQFLHSYPGRSDSVTLGEGHFALGTVYEKGAKWRAAYDEYRQAALLEPYRKRFRKAAERTEKQARKEEKK